MTIKRDPSEAEKTEADKEPMVMTDVVMVIDMVRPKSSSGQDS